MNWHFVPPLQPFNKHKTKHKQSLTLNKKKMIMNKKKPSTKIIHLKKMMRTTMTTTYAFVTMLQHT
jgi:hypothetical protein